MLKRIPHDRLAYTFNSFRRNLHTEQANFLRRRNKDFSNRASDHDNIDGILEAQEKAKELGIEFIPGIEISIEWPSGEFHLLGLGLKKPGKKLLETIEFLRGERDTRNKKIIQKLQEQNIDISYEELVEKSGTKTIGRPHFAKLLMEKGIIKKAQQAFDLFLAKGRPCYVDNTW